MKVPFAKPFFSESDVEAVLSGIRAVLESGWLTSGKNVELFEQQFAETIGSKYAVAMNSGTAALHAIFLALNVGEGDEVVVPANTFVATANAALYVGARPVFADSDPDTFNISVNCLRQKMGTQTKVVVPVHLAGNPCEMKEITETAEDNDLLVVEDCAHAHRANYRGRNCGTFGAAAAFSFYSTKVMTTGEGGMVTTDSAEIAERVRRIRNHGRGGYGPQENTELGYNFRLTDIQAIIGLNQLSHLSEFLSNRNKVAQEYDRIFARIEWANPQRVDEGNYSSYYAYIVKLTREAPISRDDLIKKLADRGIGTSILYNPVVTQPLYSKSYGERANVPVAVEHGKRSLALPMFNGMTDEELEFVKAALQDVLVPIQERYISTA